MSCSLVLRRGYSTGLKSTRLAWPSTGAGGFVLSLMWEGVGRLGSNSLLNLVYLWHYADVQKNTTSGEEIDFSHIS